MSIRKKLQSKLGKVTIKEMLFGLAQAERNAVMAGQSKVNIDELVLSIKWYRKNLN